MQQTVAVGQRITKCRYRWWHDAHWWAEDYDDRFVQEWVATQQ